MAHHLPFDQQDRANPDPIDRIYQKISEVHPPVLQERAVDHDDRDGENFHSELGVQEQRRVDKDYRRKAREDQ